jgi:hypothetical protein
MKYIICSSSGKGFINRGRNFLVKGYPGNVWEVDDSLDGQRWIELQLLLNNARVVDKTTAQTTINNSAITKNEATGESLSIPQLS